MEKYYKADYAGYTFVSSHDYSLFYTGDFYSGVQYDQKFVVTLTGVIYAADGGDVLFCQIAEDPSLYIKVSNNSDWLWRNEVPVKQYSVSTSQNLVNGIISNNKYILSNNLLCARFANKLTKEERKILYGLQNNLRTRNNALIEDGILADVQEGTPEGYSLLGPYLDSFMASPGIGVVVSTTAIVVTAVVTAALATAAYFAYKYYHNQSASDVKYSKQLTETLLSRLTEEEYKQLLNETQGIVTKSKIKQHLSLIGSGLKTLLILALGAFVVLRSPYYIDKWREYDPVN